MAKKLNQEIEPDRLASFLMLVSEKVSMELLIVCIERTNWMRPLREYTGMGKGWVDLIRHLAAELRKEVEVKS